MINEAAQIEFPDTEGMRTRGQVDLKNRGLVICPCDKPHFRIEILFGHSVSGINVEPIVGVSQSSTKRGIVAVQTTRPGFRIIAAQIEISEEHEFRVHAPGAVVWIQGITRLLVGCHEADIGAGCERLLHAGDRIVGVRREILRASLYIHHTKI